MKVVPISKSIFGDDVLAGFNYEAAVSTYNWYLENPEEAELIMKDVVLETVAKAMEESGEEITQYVISKALERKDMIKEALVNGVVNKSMSDEAVDSTVEAMDTIFKAFENFSVYERQLQAKKQKRNAKGQFVSMGTTKLAEKNKKAGILGFDNNGDVLGVDDKKVPSIKNVKRQNFVAGDADVDGKSAAQYVQSYEEVVQNLDMLLKDEDVKNNGVIAEVHINGKKDPKEIFVPGNTSSDKAKEVADDIVRVSDFARKNDYITEIKWKTGELGNNSSIPSGAYVDALSAVQGFGDGATEAGRVNFGESGTTRNMRQMGNAANFIDATGVGSANTQVQNALLAGKLVGDFGPEAEKVAGPFFRRAAYRYRGVEQPPQVELKNAIRNSIAGAQNKDDLRDRIMVPLVTESGIYGNAVTEHKPSTFLRFWQKKLPDLKLLNLHINSGAIAPSEGAVLGRDGQVVTQAVGYGDDHYLPFNPKTLKKAHGGEYVRTRTVGGLTSEDIRAGLTTGVRASTVVSHSGIFTIEYDSSFRGARRYNDKASRMIQRYQKLTDSLASNKVRLDEIPSDRKRELREAARDAVPGNSEEMLKEQNKYYETLQTLEIANPTPSKQQVEEWQNDFLLEQGEKWTDEYGDALGVEQLRTEVGYKEGRVIESNEELIDTMKLGKEYDNFLDYKTREYQSALRPLKLDGEGYFNAMKALKEQFPYYIKDVRWTPPDTKTAGIRDKGYVKRNHLRSDSIREGYFDTSIEGYDAGDGTGKRNASTENYSGYRQSQRLKQYKKKKEDDDSGGTQPAVAAPTAPSPATQPGGTPNPNSGAGASVAASSVGVPGATSALRPAFAPSGVKIVTKASGPAYEGFGTSQKTVAAANLTDYQKMQRVMKLRNDLKNIGSVAYMKPAQPGQLKATPARFNPWDATYANGPTFAYPSLFATDDDDDFLDKLSSDDVFRTAVYKEINDLYANGQAGQGRYEKSLVAALNRKKAFDGLVANKGVPQNPKSVIGLINNIKSKNNVDYDFTVGRIDGSRYLGGLGRTEYIGAWNADQDVQSFVKTAEKRFKYKVGLETEPNKFNGITRGYAQVMGQAMDQVQTWKDNIAANNNKANTQDKTKVEYGGRVYNQYNLGELEQAVAKDALAVAKIRQLHRHYDSAELEDTSSNNAIRTLSIDDLDVGTVDGKRVAIDREGKRIKSPDTPDMRVGRKSAPTQFGEINLKALDNSRERLNKMTGLDSVKQEFEDLIDETIINRQREKEGLPVKASTMHLIFTGNPGTGKTTVAEEIASSYNALGILPTTNVEKVTRSDLVGQYAGETAIKTKEAFKRAKGGVLFIDEAYSLLNGPNDSFGMEAIDEITALSEANRDNTVVILAGYSKDMDTMMTANPGLKSRFPKTIKFPDYSGNELNTIATNEITAMEYNYTPQAKRLMANIATKISELPNYSNARDARNFNDTLRRVQAKRVKEMFGDKASRESLTIVLPEDVKEAEKLYFKQRSGSVSKRLVRI